MNIYMTSRIFQALHQRGTSPALSALRALHTSSPQLVTDLSSSPRPQLQSTRDPSHPNLYYHPVSDPPPGRIALSFLSTPPAFGSRTVIGYLPMGRETDLSDFKEEPQFWKVLHAAVREGLDKGKAENLEYEAAARPGDGYIHITDERAVPPAGRIGETEDLIASVFVQDGKLVPSTYEPLPSYRLVTSNGPLILPQGLDKYVISVLERIANEESGKDR